jgi:GrpB-like predicted nucleotidyltransferase (UPF0157 family)
VIVEEEAVRIVDYDPSWPGKFEGERRLLQEILEPWLTAPIEHVGSTAIPGMPAKPIIDIVAPVSDLESSVPARAAVACLGYMYYPYRPAEEHWFCKPSPSHRTHHLHLVPAESPLWRERLLFRDYLRQHTDVAMDYAVLKQSLAERHRFDRESYTEAKGPFIRRVLTIAAAAGI